jgi:hypothetical protein
MNGRFLGQLCDLAAAHAPATGLDVASAAPVPKPGQQDLFAQASSR